MVELPFPASHSPSEDFHAVSYHAALKSERGQEYKDGGVTLRVLDLDRRVQRMQLIGWACGRHVSYSDLVFFEGHRCVELWTLGLEVRGEELRRMVERASVDVVDH